jgi:uncharacterized Zn finger protein
MAIAFTLGNLNLNDGTTYTVDAEGVNLGQIQTTWDEQVNYSGAANIQTNVIRSALIPVTIPMHVKGTSIVNLNALLTALWVEVDKPYNTLTITDTGTYNIVYSTRPDTIEYGTGYSLDFRAEFILVLMRKP